MYIEFLQGAFAIGPAKLNTSPEVVAAAVQVVERLASACEEWINTLNKNRAQDPEFPWAKFEKQGHDFMDLTDPQDVLVAVEQFDVQDFIRLWKLPTMYDDVVVCPYGGSTVIVFAGSYRSPESIVQPTGERILQWSRLANIQRVLGFTDPTTGKVFPPWQSN